MTQGPACHRQISASSTLNFPRRLPPCHAQSSHTDGDHHCCAQSRTRGRAAVATQLSGVGEGADLGKWEEQRSCGPWRGGAGACGSHGEQQVAGLGIPTGVEPRAQGMEATIAGEERRWGGRRREKTTQVPWLQRARDQGAAAMGRNGEWARTWAMDGVLPAPCSNGGEGGIAMGEGRWRTQPWEKRGVGCNYRASSGYARQQWAVPGVTVSTLGGRFCPFLFGFGPGSLQKICSLV
jgi:hypothetical protein